MVPFCITPPRTHLGPLARLQFAFLPQTASQSQTLCLSQLQSVQQGKILASMIFHVFLSLLRVKGKQRSPLPCPPASPHRTSVRRRGRGWLSGGTSWPTEGPCQSAVSPPPLPVSHTCRPRALLGNHPLSSPPFSGWFPVGTLRAGLYSDPPLGQVVAPPPGMATRLCFSVEYRPTSEQLTVSLLRLANLPPH